MTWAQARANCVMSGYELVIIDSQEEDGFIYQNLSDRNFDDTWIGLTDAAQEGLFVWVDGTNPVYEDWDDGEPNDGGRGEDCGIMLMSPGRASHWDDRPCERMYSSICEIP